MNTHAAPPRAARDSIGTLARLGYAAKGVVYILVGILAVRAAFSEARSSDSEGAFLLILRQPFGRVLLGVVAIGLLGYVIWRFAQAAYDPERRRSDGNRIGHRIYSAANGLFYLALALQAFRMATGSGRGGGGRDPNAWIAKVLDMPMGEWLVIVAGVAVIGYGAAQIGKAWAARLDRRLDLSSLSAGAAVWARRVSRFGLAARGTTFLVIGWFVIQAARAHDASRARGVGGALRTLESGSSKWVLLLVALGFVGYGCYQLLRARYRVVTA